jgi:hypothetical protein
MKDAALRTLALPLRKNPQLSNASICVARIKQPQKQIRKNQIPTAVNYFESGHAVGILVWTRCPIAGDLSMCQRFMIHEVKDSAESN